MFHGLLLFLREGTEEFDLLLIGRLPLIVHLKCTLEMLFDFDIESLRLDIDEWRVVDTWYGLGGDQVMKVPSQLGEFGARCLLLALLFLECQLSLVLRELLPDLLVLGLHMVQVGLPRIEVVLVFP